ncbi:MAG TPA: hypothetical protein VGR61_02030 [Candidatus Dormibacteraeota bacterium]|nr:hypothetical protein [Candidatus Dormibacteraeota bacterium]
MNRLLAMPQALVDDGIDSSGEPGADRGDSDVPEDIGRAHTVHFVPLDPNVFDTHYFSADVAATAPRVFAHRLA